ncbi:MAG: hypothetical protein HKN57_00630 [Xanthomonadales bacterium]|nr:prepilin-type N-terminal cleavage/methylation domain-containing protein [Gammaproteobacteria bacterium]MBT8054642.1 prepilin-type N-terminal cleavage/methylation domain-containing protein [Gammaproteobacteria bacterium]NND55732.1 hypothetical protein [Xanthomonadales bacterium]NNK50143.1 hypothetical protein [Xanthomonadales bacterium]NNL94433.1 hypothetical protein [Xanthomonadales bacterium]
MNASKRRSDRGFSLVEVAVATTLFSMGLGGLSIMLLTAIHGTTEATHQTVATVQASSLAEMIAMSSDAYGHFVDPVEFNPYQCTGECPGNSLASANFLDWQNLISRKLPGGTGLVCRDSTPNDGSNTNPSCDGSGALVVKIFWSEPAHANALDAAPMRVVSRLAW